MTLPVACQYYATCTGLDVFADIAVGFVFGGLLMAWAFMHANRVGK